MAKQQGWVIHMSDTVKITVDGREITAFPGAMLLDTLRQEGISVPTLCDHPSLEPEGACRLCVVEVGRAGKQGRDKLVTSCIYPVSDGLIIKTRSPRVIQSRKIVLEMLLARCPDSTELKAMALAQGVEGTRLPLRAKADDCILCGLCVRVCQDLGPGAIDALGRSLGKQIGPNPQKLGTECTGCQACAWVCPTGEIKLDRRPEVLGIWNREFPVAVCHVDTELCRACGLCEEACPVAIPRVTLGTGGVMAAFISAETCQGCGLCAGVCPTGAIEQAGFSPARVSTPAGDLRGARPVLACSRSYFPPGTPEIYEIPCVGKLPVEDLLELIALGAGGALVMGRDPATCPYGPGEDQAEERVEIAAEILAWAGLGSDRIRFVMPPYGFDGPARARAEFLADCQPSTQADPVTISPEIQGLDRALAIAGLLLERPGCDPVYPEEFAPLKLVDQPLFIRLLPVLDLLLQPMIRGWRLADEGIETIAACCDACSEKPETGNCFRFTISDQERQNLTARLQAGGEIICHCPAELAQLKLISRQGAWQTGPDCTLILAGGEIAAPGGGKLS
jgi:bidirectional [NiFe] hydrogenase diaphorase subunit